MTGAYWGFTLTDGALRMLVVLHFFKLGYSGVTIAFLFLFYEFFGIVTNLLGGWIASAVWLKTTLYGGLVLQIFALLMLAALQPSWARVLSVAYVMAAQALSGIAKDLTKMSAKSAIKVVVPDDTDGTLFKWVSRLTGSKNALKGAGFFVGGLLLASFGFIGALLAMAAGLLAVLLGTVVALPPEIGRSKKKVKITALFSKSAAINWLSAARLFLFGARDVWFVVGLPVFLSQLGWTFAGVGGFIALWFIGYGIIQAFVPDILRSMGREKVDGPAAMHWAFILLLIPLGLIGALRASINPSAALIVGLAAFAVVFAINSAVHSYLVLAYTDEESVALNVGFYYMAYAGGRLLGTLLSGLIFQWADSRAVFWAQV
ncbi:MAG TPA: organoarsenical effux MFS transporter ArsJ [Acidobacteriaceae bacterium]|nr:organoarsenical effux MFS transporter ArsJ [Acidobacteriaceae bacterium]